MSGWFRYTTVPDSHPAMARTSRFVSAPEKSGTSLKRVCLRPGIASGHESTLWTNSGDGLVLSFAHLSAGDFDVAVDTVAQTLATLGRAQK